MPWYKNATMFCLLLIFILTGCNTNYYNISKNNLTWNSPSEGSFGSMPLGNGDIGLNVWMERSGELLFYISKVDAFDANHLLPKLGRIRIKSDPAIKTDDFRQTLNLSDASILIKAGDADFRIWVDAGNPVINIEGKSKIPRFITIEMESLRPLINAGDSLPASGTAGVIFNDSENRLAWCYRNLSSRWGENFRSQNSAEMVAKTRDPILYRTSGCLLTASGFLRGGPATLKSEKETTSLKCSINVLTSQPESANQWLQEITNPAKSDWSAHCKYWKSFWERSYIDILTGGEGKFNLDQSRYTQFPQASKAYEGHKEIDAKLNITQINQRYALERFCEAIAGRGTVPPPYNGSIFTMDMPAGVQGFGGPLKDPVSPDGRDWADLSFMWQNTRHPYWSMAARGDYDAIRPGMQFVRNGLEICTDHCKKIFGHEGAFIMEASWMYNVGVFNWANVPPHLRYHLLASVELPAIMCEYYEHTRDRKFLDAILLPCADEFLRFYEVHFPARDNEGIMQMEGVGCVETFQGVTNPCTEIGAMKFVLEKLLSFDIDDVHREHWQKLLKAMPGVPTRMIKGIDLLAVGDKYNPGRVNCESPELYSIYPFRQVWLGRPELLASARQSFHVRTISIDGTADYQGTETGGWQASPVQAAYLGLPREAARLMSMNFNDNFIHWSDNVDPGAPFPNRPRARFPAFWECKMDGTPDNDHGANSVNSLQSMLLQSDGKKIFLLPAWPEDWDVAFRLRAADNTIVDCRYMNGKVTELRVTPSSRLKDIIDMSTPERRIKNLVEVALTDHNYLFGLPPMLDAQPIPGKSTSEWIGKYGNTIAGCKAGPWKNSLFKENTVFIHVTEWPEKGVRLPAMPRKLIASQSITGDIRITEDHDGWVLTGKPDPVSTIVRLEFDSSIDDIVMGMPSEGSFIKGRQQKINQAADGKTEIIAELGEEKTVSRMEFTIENPGYRRRQGRPFVLEGRRNGGTWGKVYEGEVYGTIMSKAFDPVRVSAVRLKIKADRVSQFDIF